MYPKLKLINSGKDAIDLSNQHTLLFTQRFMKRIGFFGDWSVGTSNVKGSLLQQKFKNNADTYLEISFVQGAELLIQEKS